MNGLRLVILAVIVTNKKTPGEVFHSAYAWLEIGFWNQTCEAELPHINVENIEEETRKIRQVLENDESLTD